MSAATKQTAKSIITDHIESRYTDETIILVTVIRMSTGYSPVGSFSIAWTMHNIAEGNRVFQAFADIDEDLTVTLDDIQQV